MENKKKWTYMEGKALIAAYKSRKDEYHTTSQKDEFWQNILTDIESMDVLVSPTSLDQVKSKWKTLCRAYFKSFRNKGADSGSSRFVYMEEMDEILGENHFLFPEHVSTESVMNRYISKKKKVAKQKLFEIKKKYYERSLQIKEEERKMLQNYLEKKEKQRERMHRELLEVLRHGCRGN